jgi:hypothetical protein
MNSWQPSSLNANVSLMPNFKALTLTRAAE